MKVLFDLIRIKFMITEFKSDYDIIEFIGKENYPFRYHFKSFYNKYFSLFDFCNYIHKLCEKVNFWS